MNLLHGWLCGLVCINHFSVVKTALAISRINANTVGTAQVQKSQHEFHTTLKADGIPYYIELEAKAANFYTTPMSDACG